MKNPANNVPHSFRSWQGFTFVSDSSSSEQRNQIHSSVLTLAEIEVGQQVRIIECQTSESAACLAQLGCGTGTELQLITRSSRGSVIVRCGEKQMGLGATIARSIIVNLIS